MAEIRSNLHRIKEQIAAAAQRAGRCADDVQLVAVTKQRPLADIRELIALGERSFGENRVPEAVEKVDAIAADSLAHPVDWHFIGHLQTNKVKKLAAKFALLHSVDSAHLAEALQRAADGADCVVNVLLEVNVSGEESKYGIAPANLENVAASLRPFDRVRCQGLMTMAPFVDNAEETRPVFQGLRLSLERLREKGFEHLDLRHLSMGMTNDFEVAVEEGATLVRVGTALFS